MPTPSAFRGRHVGISRPTCWHSRRKVSADGVRLRHPWRQRCGRSSRGRGPGEPSRRRGWRCTRLGDSPSACGGELRSQRHRFRSCRSPPLGRSPKLGAQPRRLLVPNNFDGLATDSFGRNGRQSACHGCSQGPFGHRLAHAARQLCADIVEQVAARAWVGLVKETSAERGARSKEGRRRLGTAVSFCLVKKTHLGCLMTRVSRRRFLGIAAGVVGSTLAIPRIAVGQEIPSKIDVAIVGGGVSGLFSAMRLRAAGINVALFEASDRLGGRVMSVLLPGFSEDAAEIGAMRLRTTDEMDKRFFGVDAICSPCVDDLVAKSGAPAASSVGPPYSSLAGLRRPRRPRTRLLAGRGCQCATRCS